MKWKKKNLRMDAPQGISLCPLSSSVSILGRSETKERKPKVIKEPECRMKTQNYSRPPKDCDQDPELPPQLFSIDSGVITISPTD